MINKKIILIVLFIFLLSLSFTSCGSKNDEEDSNEESEESSVSKVNYDVEYDSDDTSTDSGDSVTEIVFEEDKVSVDGEGAKESDGDVTIIASGTYNVSGTSNDSRIIINSEDKGIVKLILDNVNLTSKKSAPINILEAKKTVITLVKGSENSLVDTENYEFDDEESDEPNATIFSKDDLTINGGGTLYIEAKYKHGIKCNDKLKILSANIEINSVSNGVRGNDFVALKDADLTIKSSGDGIKSNNGDEEDKGFIFAENTTLNINSEKDVIQAATGISLNDSKLVGTAGGGSENASENRGNDDWGGFNNFDNNANENSETDESNEDSENSENSKNTENNNQSIENENKETTSDDEDSEGSSSGLTAEVDITLNNSDITIDASGDAIHSNKNCTFESGELNLSAGDDGIHADTILEINSGNLTVKESYEAIESAQITINDGKVILTASDDGVNGSNGSGGEMFGGPGGQSGGGENMNNAPQFEEGEMPEEGERPEGGEMPQDGEMPENNENRQMPQNQDNTNQDNTNSENQQTDDSSDKEEVSFTMNGGYLYVNAGGDGIDIGGTVEINEGTVIVNGPTNNGNGALDADNGITVNGGLLIAAGSSGMAETPNSSSKQNSISMTFDSQLSSKTLIHLESEKGDNIITFMPAKEFQNIIISSPDLNTDENYILYSGGSAEGEDENGLYSDESYKAGDKEEEFTISEVITSLGATTGGFGGKGGQGFQQQNQNN
jgi:hypothetical protein